MQGKALWFEENHVGQQFGGEWLCEATIKPPYFSNRDAIRDWSTSAIRFTQKKKFP